MRNAEQLLDTELTGLTVRVATMAAMTARPCKVLFLLLQLQQRTTTTKMSTEKKGVTKDLYSSLSLSFVLYVNESGFQFKSVQKVS